jgi:hypothetical protein
MNTEMVEQMLIAPDSQISPVMKEWIAQWSSPPTVEEITITRDLSAYTSQCSDFVIRLLTIMIDNVALDEQKEIS